jgi:hypothetical protein
MSIYDAAGRNSQRIWARMQLSGSSSAFGRTCDAGARFWNALMPVIFRTLPFMKNIPSTKAQSCQISLIQHCSSAGWTSRQKWGEVLSHAEDATLN